MELYIFEYGIEGNQDDKLNFIYKEIEYYHFVFIKVDINQNILTFVKELITIFDQSLFDWPNNSYFDSIGWNLLFLESFKLSNDEWDLIIKLALKHNLQIFNDETKTFFPTNEN